ncbi:hypothetical protein CISIN_1g047466mg [Citrus sinensis]|uniref:Uncharacterized protein n=1 Tax=Citrus sinensis TaxID=2711 RepID=A0A067G8J0_CITSI|nr:hypothetical protein CISIN_1g047466mg [Citrus sinensis]
MHYVLSLQCCQIKNCQKFCINYPTLSVPRVKNILVFQQFSIQGVDRSKEDENSKLKYVNFAPSINDPTSFRTVT